MKHTLLLFCLLLGIGLSAMVALGPLRGREVQSLNGVWQFKTDPQDAGVKAEWFKQMPKETIEAQVPSLWQRKAAPGYNGAVWYWREIQIADAWKKKHVRLRFGAVARQAASWLDGAPLGESKTPFTPIIFDITKRLRADRPSLLAVRVTNIPAPHAEEGGIWQDVSLIAADEAHITDVFVKPKITGWMTVQVEIENASDKSGDAEIEVEVFERNNPKKRVGQTTQYVAVSPGRNRADLLLRVRSPRLWSPDSPALYQARVQFRQDRDLLDNVTETFGFREFAAEEGRLLLNGSPITLTRMKYPTSDSLAVVLSEDAERVEHKLTQAKEAGQNFVLADGQAAPEALQIADRIGLLVAEAPASAGDAEALIRRDRNHPSILFWTPPDDENLAKRFREWDPTRVLHKTGGSGE